MNRTANRKYKKFLMIVIWAFLSMAMAKGVAFGYILTVDGIDDAGLYPGQTAYAQFVVPGCDVNDLNATCTVINAVSAVDHPQQFTSQSDVYDYLWAEGITSEWWLQSAGNVWSSDLVVGESLVNLSAGTYRVRPAGGAYVAYQYDSFGWSDLSGLYWWQLHIDANYIQGNGNIVDDFYMLGSFSPTLSSDSAFFAVKDNYIDITLPQTGALKFWIWDGNSIDNSGGLAFNVTQIPEPSTALLLIVGLSFLIRRRLN